MSCDRFVEDLSAWIDGELPAGRAAEVAAHVAACAACGAQVAALRRADDALRAIPLRELPPDALTKVLRRSARGRAPASRRRWLGWAGAAAGASAAAAALVAWFLVRPGPIDSASPEDLAVASDLDTVEDLEVIANLDVLEAYVAQEGDRG
jgi:anti-sigma factor RsiW